jgi:hypothetical protein
MYVGWSPHPTSHKYEWDIKSIYININIMNIIYTGMVHHNITLHILIMKCLISYSYIDNGIYDS